MYVENIFILGEQEIINEVPEKKIILSFLAMGGGELNLKNNGRFAEL